MSAASAGGAGADSEEHFSEFEIQLQVPSKDWLEVYGLLAQSLTLDQLLPSLGFIQSKGHVEALQQSVSSRYADGLFVQHEDSAGNIYNLCGANPASLQAIENDLQKALALFKARHNWLITDSRLSFGVIYERKVVLLLDSCATEHAQLRPFLDVATAVTKEQLCRVEQFNIIRCHNDVKSWKTGLSESSEDSIASAVQWIEGSQPQTVPFKTNIVEGVLKALAHSDAEGIYLLAHGDCTLRAFDSLLEKVGPSLIPVHMVVYGCKTPQALEQYRQLANASSARCHSYVPPPQPAHDGKKNPLLSSFSSLSSAGSHSPPTRRPTSGRSISPGNKSHPQSAVASTPPPPPPTEDVLAILEEIELTRNTLAEIQALQLEVGGADLVPTPTEQEVSEESLTSEQWLEIYGLKAKKLMYEDLVASLAFQHCNGTVQIPVPKYKKSTQTIQVVPHSKIVHAQYCKDFVHIRWHENKTVHIQLTARSHKTYRTKVEGLVKRCEQRLNWLKQGSRQLFGTLLESRVVIVIDTSSSVKERLDLIKHKVEELLQEQLSQKKEFTIMHFNSDVHPWRTSLVPTSPQNLLAVGQWVQGLLAGGSTNTLAALEAAMSVREAEAVYLLTDGRPDQPLDQILARVQQLASIPVHTISFNCADSNANFFLARLASNTGGRYYYFSEDTSDPEGPNTYQGEDIQRLEEEVACAHEQLQLADHLLSECNAVRRKGKKKGGGKKGSPPTPRRRSKGSGKLMPSKRWLEKNSLSALKLTLMDAFGPASIRHTSRHVPMLGKQVASKVFNSLFPLAHVSCGQEVTLIHPNGVNLGDYEARLDKQLQVYWDRLGRLAWCELSEERRSGLAGECGLGEGEVPSYKEHRSKLREVLAESGWPRPQMDFDLLEKEIELGGNFKKYLKALKKEVRSGSTLRDSHSSLSDYRWSDEEDGEVVGLYSPSPSLASLGRDRRPTSSPPYPVFPKVWGKKKRAAPCRVHRRGQQVVVRPGDEPFYYPGVVAGYGGRREVVVDLVDKQQVTAPADDIIVVGGASPCPVLAVGDHVLARVRTKNGPHPSRFGGLSDCYIPGTVQGCPRDIRKGGALYLVMDFGGRGVGCSRHAIIKIGRSKYNQLCKLIKEKGIRPLSITTGDEGEDIYCFSRGHSQSRLDTARGSIHVPGASVDASPHPSPRPSPYHTDLPRASSAANMQSHSGSRASSARSAQSHSGSRVSLPEARRGSAEQSPSLQEKEEVRLLVEQQKAQGELLEQQQRELALMLLKQQELEQQLRGAGKGSPAAVKRGEESPDFFQSPPHPSTSDPPAEVTEVQAGGSQEEVRSQVGVEQEVPRPGLREQAMNTDTWTEEKGIVTDPMTESRAVGTEWTEDSSVDEEDSSVDEEDSSMESEPDSESTSVPQEPGPVSPSPSHPHSPDPQEHRTVTPPSSLTLSTPASTVATPLPTPLPTPEEDNNNRQLGATPGATPTSTPTHITSTDITITPSHASTGTPVKGPEEEEEIEEEEDPLVNQYVLARWPDDGWYYRGLVVRHLGNMWYQVQDAAQDVEKIHALDILTDLQDAQRPLLAGDTVAALHPCFERSYAPGVVGGASADGLHFSVVLYDGTETFLPRQEMYRLAPAKHRQDVEMLRTKESLWVGQAVVARRDSDGLYLPGEVLEQLEGACLYLLEWADGSTQEQEVTHMFGKLTRKRGLRHGDNVLALAVPDQGVCMPGTITGREGRGLCVEFCDGESSVVDPTQCFWLSPEYYQQAVEYIADNVSTTSAASLGGSLGGSVGRREGRGLVQSEAESELSSKYTPSYLH